MSKKEHPEYSVILVKDNDPKGGGFSSKEISDLMYELTQIPDFKLGDKEDTLSFCGSDDQYIGISHDSRKIQIQNLKKPVLDKVLAATNSSLYYDQTNVSENGIPKLKVQLKKTSTLYKKFK